LDKEKIMNTTNIAFSEEAFDVFLSTLNIMGKGMAGIFIFMIIFYLLIITLEKIYKPKNTEE